MYELNRVRLVSVGPPKARYDNVLIDFSDDPADPASLPSVLWLQNGGGKGVLLKLLFSVLLPHRRDTLGAESDTRTLNNMVLAGDTAHIALEWRRVDGAAGVPPLLVTGKVWEWQGLRVSGDSGKLHARYYTFNPVDGVLTLDTLPVIEPHPDSGEPRKIRLVGVVDRLSRHANEHPALSLAVEQRLRPWQDHLVRVGLDPELFRYQVLMNRAEGKADEVFKFGSDRAFVDFFLTAILDRDEAQALADFVAEYADKLTSRDDYKLQAEFIAGALERLRPLAGAHEHAERARSELVSAYAASSDAADGFAAAASERAAAAEALEEVANEQGDRRQRLDREYDRLNEQRAELAKHVAEFRFHAARQDLEQAGRRRDLARLTTSGWQAVWPLTRYNAALARRDELARQLQAAETDAEPLRVRRDEAATRLAATLAALVRSAREQARARDTESQELLEQAGGADDDALRDTRAAEGASRDIAAIEREVAAAAGTREQLERDGLVQLDETPAAAMERHESEREALAGRQADAEARVTATDDRLAAIADELAELGQVLATIRPALEAATGEHARLSAEAQRLAAHPVLGEIVDSDAIELWAGQVRLLEGLREQISRSERALVDTRLEAVDDERTVEGVASDGLIPPHRDALDTVQALQSLGISAHPGWRYLHDNVTPHARADALARCPQLAAGVVIAVPEHLDRARAAVSDSTRDVRTLVSLGDARAMLAAAVNDDARLAIVPPAAGLYDEDAAAEQAERAQRRLQRAGEQRSAHELTITGLRKLLAELTDFLAACPAGKLDEFGGEIAALTAQEASARGSRERLDGERERLRSQRTQVRAQITTLSRQLTAADRAAPRVLAWADASERAAEGQRRLGELSALLASLNAAVGEHRDRARELRERANQLHGQADADAKRADDLATELGQLRGIASEHERDATPAAEDLDGARTQYELADRSYREQTSESQLAADHEDAEAAASEALAQLADFDDEVGERAKQLLGEHPGADRSALRAAARAADHEHKHADDAYSSAQSRFDTAERDLKAAQPASDRTVHIVLPPELLPADLDRALALHAQVHRDAEAKLVELNGARAAATEAAARAQNARHEAATLNDMAEALRQALDTARTAFELEALPSAEARFAGTIEAAREQRTELQKQLTAASGDAQRTAAQVRELVAAVIQHARDPRFVDIRESAMVARLAEDVAEQIAASAAQRTRDLAQRAEQITKILAEIGQHRDGLIRTLTGLVKRGLHNLKAAGRASRLPDGLHEWSGRDFLRVDFQVPDNEDTLHDRLGSVLDDAANGRADRDAIGLVLKGVHAAVRPAAGGDGGVRVTILKPDSVLENVRVPVAEMSLFSGGQRLTAAIALYCALAAMRAAERGRTRGVKTGALFLDNPLGTANAEYLLHIQLRVAQALGVQLIYTTGINDLNALTMFGRVIPLRNDADLRQGLRFVHIVPELLDVLRSGRELDDERGYLSSAVLVAPRAAASGGNGSLANTAGATERGGDSANGSGVDGRRPAA